MSASKLVASAPRENSRQYNAKKEDSESAQKFDYFSLLKKISAQVYRPFKFENEV
jgi:hypothetical protein